VFWMLSFLTPDFTYSPGARYMGETFKILKFGGVGRLLMESERQGDGIALHYSMASVHAATITGNEPERGRSAIGRDFSADRDGWVRVLKDLGLQFDFVAYEQVEKGMLSKYRVFILPFSMALSPAEAASIRRFVEDGGILVADAAAGLMDSHCAWVPGGVLNDVFGMRARASAERRLTGSTVVERNEDGDLTGRKTTPGITGPLSVSADGAQWGLRAEVLDGVEAVESEVHVEGGTALGRISGADMAITRRVGKGWAIYLNALLDRYPEMRSKGYGGAGYRALVGGLLEHLGIRPAVRVTTSGGGALRQALVARYRFGDGEVLAVVKENVVAGGSSGRDGVTSYTTSGAVPSAGEEISIQLPEPMFVYDIVSGRASGKTDVVHTSIAAGGALVLGLTRRDEKLTLTGPDRSMKGKHPVFEARTSTPGKHLLRCHFFAPNGSFLPEYSRNVLSEGGAGRIVFPSALSDPQGSYRLEATDLLSGARSEITFSLR
jgi:hypothetical protein